MSLISGGGGGSSQTVLSASVSFTSAELLVGNSSPKTIVAAAAATVFLPLALVCRMTFATAAYATHPNIGLYMGSVAAGDRLINVGNVLNLAASGVDIETGPVSDIEFDAAIVNQPLTVAVNDGNPTAGGGSLTVTVYYVAVSVT